MSASDPAGVINESGRANETAFRAMIGGFSEPVQELSLAVRDLIYDVLPQTVEVVWPRQRSVGWGTGPKKFTEQFCYLQAYKSHVSLGFYRGGELPDPDGLLPTTGGTQAAGKLSMRGTQLRTLDEVKRPALRNLIEAATRTGVPPPRRR